MARPQTPVEGELRERRVELRIAFLTDKSAPFYVGGYEARVFELARRLSRAHTVRVYTSLPAESAVVDGVTFIRACTTSFQASRTGGRSLAHSALFGLSLLRNKLAEFDADAVVVEAIPYIHLATMGRWLPRRRFILVLDVLEAWSGFRYTNKPLVGTASQAIISSCLQRGVRQADQVLAISQATYDSLVANYGLDRRRANVLPLGIDSGLWASKHQGTQADPAFDVVSVGRLVQSKRPLDLVQALERLKTQRGWDGKAAIVGDGPLRRALSEEISRRGLSKQIVLTGLVSEEEKRSLLRSSRIFVLPSEREGFSLATLEAMASGLPVVVSRPRLDEVFGVAEFVREGANGLLYPSGDVAALAGQIERLLLHPEEREDLSRAAVATAKRFSWDALANRLETLLINRPA